MSSSSEIMKDVHFCGCFAESSIEIGEICAYDAGGSNLLFFWLRFGSSFSLKLDAV